MRKSRYKFIPLGGEFYRQTKTEIEIWKGYEKDKVEDFRA